MTNEVSLFIKPRFNTGDRVQNMQMAEKRPRINWSLKVGDNEVKAQAGLQDNNDGEVR